MKKRPLASPAATAMAVVFATIVLGACGADDSPPSTGASAGSSGSSGSSRSSVADAGQTAPSSPAPAAGLADTVSAGDPANDDANAQSGDSAVQSAQTSLAADSRQIAPVMSYAPGDSGAGTDTRQQ